MESKPPFLIFKENLQKIQFCYFAFDSDFILNRKSHEIIESITQEFYYKHRHHSPLFSDWKRFFFNLDYKMNPKKYPGLINPENLKLENHSMAIPGNPIDYSLLIGYFKEFKMPSGLYFTNIFGRSIAPISPLIQSILKILKAVETPVEQPPSIESAPPAGDKENSVVSPSANPQPQTQAPSMEDLQADQKPDSVSTAESPPPASPQPAYLEEIKMHARDIELISMVCQFIEQLFTYAQKENLPQMKSGHLISFVSGMKIYFEKLSRVILEFGLAAVTADPSDKLFPQSLRGIIQNLIDILDNAVVCFSLDLLSPIFSSIRCKAELIGGRIELVDQTPIPQTFVSRVLYFLFDKKNKSENKPRESFSKPADVQVKPRDPNKVLEEQIMDPHPFIELYTGLKKFNDMLRASLAPDINEEGTVLNFKQGFDQFDTPEHARVINFNKVVLAGKFAPGETDNYAGTNEMVVRSTYWIYDRAASILKAYRFSKEGVMFEKARHFIDDVKALFYPSRNEYNDIRTYGIFPQFKINAKRIFNSRSIQNKFITHINHLSELLDTASQPVAREETRRANLNNPR